MNLGYLVYALGIFGMKLNHSSNDANFVMISSHPGILCDTTFQTAIDVMRRNFSRLKMKAKSFN